MSVEPIKPYQAKQRKIALIPDFVIEAFNELITHNLSQGLATVKQKDALVLIQAKATLAGNPCTSEQIYENRWFDVEPLFRKAGWKVMYDKPAYNENYDAFYQFTEKRNERYGDD